jgi:site-specific recombinase XerD
VKARRTRATIGPGGHISISHFLMLMALGLPHIEAQVSKKRSDYLFPRRRAAGRDPMGRRQLSRLLKFWVAEAGLDPSDYSLESLRRTKALHILKGTGDLQTVRALLGHARIESTARYLGLKTNADPIKVCRAFDI